jgi:hypothetical protein
LKPICGLSVDLWICGVGLPFGDSLSGVSHREAYFLL